MIKDSVCILPRLNGDPRPWLLDESTPAVRHQALRRLLDRPQEIARHLRECRTLGPGSVRRAAGRGDDATVSAAAPARRAHLQGSPATGQRSRKKGAPP